MKHSTQTYIILISALAAVAGPVLGQQPPDVVQSDRLGNTAMGTSALLSLIPPPNGGSSNTAVGGGSLRSNTTGTFNTAIGFASLQNNTTGNYNTAAGTDALWLNISGHDNTAFGFNALTDNTTGAENTASGTYALETNNGGADNTATGFNALAGNTFGDNNVAVGVYALYGNTTGAVNAAFGSLALISNRTGSQNTACGAEALYLNTTGGGNTAVGASALRSNTAGGNNIAVGYYAGSNIGLGYRNIDIGNVGAAADAGTIRVGTSGQQQAAYIAGISTAHVTGAAVFVTPTGQLGVLASSERYKTAIAPMGAASQKLQQLRPVTFHLKNEPQGALQYGLIAEEVSQVYPDLVIRDESGTIQGVRYDELAPLLLNEVQQQRQQMVAQDVQLHEVQQQVAALKELSATTQIALQKLQGAGVVTSR